MNIKDEILMNSVNKQKEKKEKGVMIETIFTSSISNSPFF
jgi:hypothetical protein